MTRFANRSTVQHWLAGAFSLPLSTKMAIKAWSWLVPHTSKYVLNRTQYYIVNYLQHYDHCWECAAAMIVVATKLTGRQITKCIKTELVFVVNFNTQRHYALAPVIMYTCNGKHPHVKGHQQTEYMLFVKSKLFFHHNELCLIKKNHNYISADVSCC